MNQRPNQKKNQSASPRVDVHVRTSVEIASAPRGGLNSLRHSVASMARAQSRQCANDLVADYGRTGVDPVEDLARVSGLSEADWNRILPDPEIIDSL
jgi:hypothetical protein